MLLLGFRTADGGYTIVSAANPLPVTGGGGGGGDASEATLLEVAANTLRSADALETIEADTSTSAVAQVSYVDAATITPGTPVTAGQGVAIRCTAEGNVALKLSSGTTLIVAAKVGQSWIDNIAVTDVVAGSTTGTHVVSVLYRV